MFPGATSSNITCPDGFHRCAGRCLALLYESVSYAEAESRCAELGAHLAVPRSEAENQCAVNASGGVQVWLGITSKAAQGRYVGADGLGELAPSSLLWAAGEPSDPATQPLLVLTPPGLAGWETGWHDIADWLQARPLCQRALN